MGHRREEIGFRFVRNLRFSGRLLELLIETEHDGQIKYEQDQESRGNKTDQQPVFGICGQVLHWHKVKKRPPSCRCNRRIGKDAFLTARVAHGDRAGCRGDGFKKLLRGGWIRSVIGSEELKEAGILEGMTLDDIFAVRVDHGKLGVFKLFLREDPFLLQL